MKLYRFLTAICFLLLIIQSVTVFGRTAKVGYFEGGPYFMHKVVLAELKGYLESMKSDDLKIIYEPYAYFSADWDREKCRAMARDAARLRDIDIIIAAGPWVVEDLLEAGYEKTIVAVYQFAPEIEGLIGSNGVPVASNLTVDNQAERTAADMKAIQDLFPTQRVGVLYFAPEEQAAVLREKIQNMLIDYGAWVHGASEYSNRGLYSFFKSFQAVRNKIDVLYLPPLWGMDLEQIRQFYVETQYAGIPTFSSEGFLQVEKGATASGGNRPDRVLAKFSAYKILRILDGAEPSSLPTSIQPVQALCLNLESANKLGITFRRNHIVNSRTIAPNSSDTIPRYRFHDAVRQALVENSTMLQKECAYQRVLAEAKKAAGEFYPSINLMVSSATSDNTLKASEYNRWLNRKFYADFILDQKIFSFSSIKAIEIAGKRSEMGEISLRQAELDLSYAVTVAYLSVLENEEQVAVYEEIVSLYRDYWELAAAGYKMGLADSTDIPLLEEHQVKAKIRLHEALNELRISRIVLNVLLNRPGHDNLVLDREEFGLERLYHMARQFENYVVDASAQKRFEEYLISKGIAGATDMEIADLSIAIQNKKISINKYRFLPEVRLRAKYTYGEEFSGIYEGNEDTWTFGGMVHFPLFSGEQWRGRGRALQEELRQLYFGKDVMRFSHVENIMAEADRFATRLSTLPMRYYVGNLSESNLESWYAGYESGEATIFELLRAVENKATAALDLIEDRNFFFMSYVDLLYAIGQAYPPWRSDEERRLWDEMDEYMMP